MQGRESRLGIEWDILTRCNQRDDDTRDRKEADLGPEQGTFPAICRLQRKSEQWPNIAVRVNGEGDEQQRGEMERRDRGAGFPRRDRDQRQKARV